jgi:separase
MGEGAQDLNRINLIGQDTDLAPFATHITNSLRVIIGFHDGKMDAGDLDDTLASWASMARQCSDWETLLGFVHDTEYWVLQLKALVDYTEIHGLWKAQLNALELILRAAELQKSGDLSDAIIILSRLVLQHCQLGHCQKAGKLLVRGEQYLTQHSVSSLASISFKLAKVEHLLETGEVDKASTALSMARKMYEKTQKSDELSGLSVLAKISWERMVADAAFVQSRLSTAQGSMTHALYFAKLSVRLNCRIWAKVERLAQKKQDKSLSAAGSSDMDAVAEGVAKLDLSQNGSSPDVSPSYIQGAPFWPHLGSYHTCLLNLATLSAHHGLFQDAIYYGEQALKIDKTLDANIRLVAAQTQLGCYRTIGGDVVEGQELLMAASESSKQLPASVETVSLQMALASLYKAQDIMIKHFGYSRRQTRSSLLSSPLIQSAFQKDRMWQLWRRRWKSCKCELVGEPKQLLQLLQLQLVDAHVQQAQRHRLPPLLHPLLQLKEPLLPRPQGQNPKLIPSLS